VRVRRTLPRSPRLTFQESIRNFERQRCYVNVVEHYLKVVHHTWSKKVLRKWVKISAAVFAWISGVVYDMALVFSTSAVVDGVCYGYLFWKSRVAAVAHGIWNFITFIVVVVFVFVFCYGRILVVIRRQARIMASHSGPGSSTTQTQSYQIQSNLDQVPLRPNHIRFSPAWIKYH